MLYIQTALYFEAEPFIKHFNLKQDLKETKYSLFSSDTVKLCITGVGEINAAISLSRFFTQNTPSKKNDLFLSVGSCVAEKRDCVGNIYLINKIHALSTGRDFYPDVHKSLLPLLERSTITTVPKVQTSPLFADMEASAVFEAASSYFTLEKLIFIKIATDTGADVSRTTIIETYAQAARELIYEKELFMDPYISSSLIAPINESVTPNDNNNNTFSSKLTNRLYTLFGRTASYEEKLRQYINYYCLFDVLPGGLCEDLSNYMNSYELSLRDSDGIFHKEVFNKAFDGIMDIFKKYNEVPAFHKISHPVQFENIYVEESLFERDDLKSQLDSLISKTDAPVIHIKHYKDIFNRSHQNFRYQKEHPSLILSADSETHIYPGADPCQSFGNEHFYYASLLKNCLYDCEYCYLQGMYPSADIVAFLDLDSTFKELTKMLEEHPVYLCISYDADLLSLEGYFGYVKRWMDFARLHPDLTLEIRTKCANTTFYENNEPLENVIFAYTVSDEAQALAYEHRAPSPEGRLAGIAAAVKYGYPVRLIFDPVILHGDYKTAFRDLLNKTFSVVSPTQIRDAGLGTFRIAKCYLKTMKKNNPSSVLANFPFYTCNGICTQTKDDAKVNEELRAILSEYMDNDKIYTLK